MTLYEFNALPEPEQQLAAVFATARFVTTRWEQALAVSLYFFAGAATGFFAEVYYDPDANRIVRLRSFTSTDQLTGFTAGVRLPDAG